MLRRKPSDTALLDETDLNLLRAVEAGSTWRALLQSCACDAEEAQLRILRLIYTGHLEGQPGDAAPVTAPASSASHRPTVRPTPRASASHASAVPTANPRSAPTSPSEARGSDRAPNTDSAQAAKTVPPSARAARDALLRELSVRRASTSYPPLRVSEPATPISTSPSPGAYGIGPRSATGGQAGSSRPPTTELEPGAALISSAPPGRYSMYVDAASGPISSTPPGQSEVSVAHDPARFDRDFDSPLAALIDEFANGPERDRWCAARLRDALREELSGNVQQAISILQSLTVQLSDSRIRDERDRLQSRSVKVTSGVYRSRALLAERADKHKEAADSWRKVLEACPDDAEAALHASQCSMEIGDLRQAGVHARRAVELAPDSVAAHRLLWRFFRKTGMEHNANRERDILRKLSKGNG